MWQTSIGSLMGAADSRDFVMHSRIGVLHALNQNFKGMFNSGHKDTLGKQFPFAGYIGHVDR